MAETFDGDWLALREPFDAASRSVALAQRLGAALPARARLIDLGAGTGSLFRWLAPILDRPQEWTLADADAALLERAFAEISRWATSRGLPVTATASSILRQNRKTGWNRLNRTQTRDHGPNWRSRELFLSTCFRA